MVDPTALTLKRHTAGKRRPASLILFTGPIRDSLSAQHLSRVKSIKWNIYSDSILMSQLCSSSYSTSPYRSPARLHPCRREGDGDKKVPKDLRDLEVPTHQRGEWRMGTGTTVAASPVRDG